MLMKQKHLYQKNYKMHSVLAITSTQAWQLCSQQQVLDIGFSFLHIFNAAIQCDTFSKNKKCRRKLNQS